MASSALLELQLKAPPKAADAAAITRAPRSRLDIFFNQSAELQIEAAAICQMGDGSFFQLLDCQLIAFTDGHYGIVCAQCLRQLLRAVARGSGVEA